MYSLIFDTIKVIFILIFVLALMMITLKTLSKYQNKLSGSKNINVLERASLSQNTTLNIVKVGSKLYLMSSSANGVSILKEIEEADINTSIYNKEKLEGSNFPFDNISKDEITKWFKGKNNNEKKGN